jgi:hypothetical protein
MSDLDPIRRRVLRRRQIDLTADRFELADGMQSAECG